MNYKEFNRLFIGDRVVFLLGMELFLENGRGGIMEHTEEELGRIAGEKLAGFLMQNKVKAVVQAAQAFAQMKTAALLSYAGKSGIRIGGNDLDIHGVCPVCGGPLIYEETATPGVDLVVGWTCQDCDATGKEVYQRVFNCHVDVRLGDGRPVPPREK